MQKYLKFRKLMVDKQNIERCDTIKIKNLRLVCIWPKNDWQGIVEIIFYGGVEIISNFDVFFINPIHG